MSTKKKLTTKRSGTTRSRAVKTKTRSATGLTVDTKYARIALLLLALNFLFTGYVVAKLALLAS
jgi:hypothetical protein